MKTPASPFTIGFLGRFTEQKGLRVLLDAFRKVRKTRPDVRLRLAGSGPFPIPKMPGVSVDGWVPYSHDWFSNIHVLVAPSLPWENLGMSPIEALAHGVPAIVSDSGGLPETVGSFGAVTRAGDVDGLARAINDVAGSYPEARNHALAGREWVREEFSAERHIERLMGVYKAAKLRAAPLP